MPWLHLLCTHFVGLVYDFFATTHNTKKESNTRTNYTRGLQHVSSTEVTTS